MKTFVIGDIHGGYKALKQCLERSSFDYKEDLLILIGDICDGWSQTFECVEELLKIENRIFILGNHDDWFIDWLEKGMHPVSWLQGGHTTAKSYIDHAERDGIDIMQRMGGYVTNLTTFDIPIEHVKFWKNHHLKYHDTDRNYLFVHGGFIRDMPISVQDRHDFLWNRSMFDQAMSYESSLGKFAKEGPNHKFKMVDPFELVFIGHTATINWGKPPITTPIKAGPVWNVDTGGGWMGKLTIMNIDTKEYWQSDPVQELYKGERGRL